MKNKSIIFATSTPNSFFRYKMSVAIFIAMCWLLSVKIRGYHFPVGYYILCRNFEFGDLGNGSLSLYKYFYFSHTMPNSMKSKSKSKHSTLTLPSFHETEIQLQQAVSLPEITNVLIQVFEQLRDKVELHIHLVVQNTVNGNNVASIYGNASSIGHKIVGDGGSIDGLITTERS